MTGTSRAALGFFLFCFFLIYLFLWLCWVFVSVRGLSPVAASGGHSSSRCAGLSLSRPLLLAEHRLQTRRLGNCGSGAPRHVGSSQTRAQTRVPCIGRQILNHCATRETPFLPFKERHFALLILLTAPINVLPKACFRF